MTEFENTLIDNTKELMSDLMKHLSSIESVEIVKDFVAQGEIVVLLPDGSVKALDIINQENRTLLKDTITHFLDCELSESLTKLKYLTDAHSSYRYELVDDTAEEPAEEPVAEPQMPRIKSKQDVKVELNIEEITKLRDKGWSLKKIAARFGVCEQTVLNKINKANKSRKEQAS